MFHFISLEDLNDRGNEEFNFSYFNAIGIEAPISDYASNTNIKNYRVLNNNTHYLRRLKLFNSIKYVLIFVPFKIYSKNLFVKINQKPCLQMIHLWARQYFSLPCPKVEDQIDL